MALFQKETKIALAETIIKYDFRNKDLIWEALQYGGSLHTTFGQRRTITGNRELAALGDSVMQMVLTAQWFASNQYLGWSTQYQYYSVPSNAVALILRAF